MKNCYFKGNDTSWNENSWLKYTSANELLSVDSESGERNYSGKKYNQHKDIILSIDTNAGMIFITKINTEKYLEQGRIMSDYFLKTKAGKREKIEILSSGGSDPNSNFSKNFWRSFIRSYENRQIVEQDEYVLLTFVDNLAIGIKKNSGVVDEKIFVNIEKGTFVSGMSLDGNNLPQLGREICNNQLTSSNDETANSSGTAFFINNRGHLLTNNHVVEGCALNKIVYKNNDYEAKLIATDKALDLALLKTEINPKSFINFSKEGANKLNKIYVAGYPLGKSLSDDLKITSGIVSSLKGYDDNSNEIQIDAPINPGNSGGPIINENGDLVAIAVSGLAKDQTEGINFGIKSSAAELFLKSNRVTPKKSMYGGLKDNDKLLEILEEATVYTYCN
ncbi:serine protease [Candidatus Pelagibacter bacterium]|nr:serine protease [Candidatus Pelagibacter bacterium]